ncbi:hypothetical protein AAG570_006724 [Ranatra chinensis]|uniref:Glycolipid transfer protein domain-containing protein n=1 Tax=Ranatra chinensis TaxID=642074 RepID=A0ABD0Z7K6_9HEMI
MGSFFSFIETEINSKSAILTDLIGNDENGNFSTVKSMMRHEMDSGLLKKSGYVSGCRTLLRLHRGLDFIRQFLKHVYELRSDEGTSSVCMKVYSKTLGNFHPWLIRQGAYLAMYTLPSRAALLNRVNYKYILTNVYALI